MSVQYSWFPVNMFFTLLWFVLTRSMLDRLIMSSKKPKEKMRSVQNLYLSFALVVDRVWYTFD